MAALLASENILLWASVCPGTSGKQGSVVSKEWDGVMGDSTDFEVRQC